MATAAQLTGVRQLAAPGRAGREAPSIRRGAAPYGDGSRRSPTAQYSEILRLPLPRASPSPPAHRPARLSPASRCTGRTKRAKAGSISALSGRLSRTLRGRAFSARSRGVLCVGDDYITSSLSRTQQHGPIKLTTSGPTATIFTQFQVPKGHKCFGCHPSAQCKGLGPWSVTLIQVVTDDDGNKSKISHTAKLRLYRQ